MVKKFNLFMTFLIMLMLIIGCSSGSELKNLTVNFSDEANTVSTEGFHIYTVQISDKSGSSIDVDKVYLYMNMKMMNHPIEGTMNRVEEGLYQLELPLSMAGEWYANLTVTFDEDTKVFEDFLFSGEGEKQMEYITGYHADEQ
ncbi:FixH family protein [Bacillaceae bacterium IKA-2]|jgi:hypothetical protein|nr:FixH family protein [Bacillaceae bacterium IKA-2]